MNRRRKTRIYNKGAYPYYKCCPNTYIQGVAICELWFSGQEDIKKGSLREIRGNPLWGWRRPTFPQPSAVSSARRGLTSLFGMGRGGPPRYSHRVSLVSDNRLEGGSDRGLTRRAWRWDGPLRARPSGY